MNGFIDYFTGFWQQAEWTERIGWTLLHSLWQIALLSVAYAIAALAMRGRMASARYLTGCAAMAAMLALPMATYVLLSGAAVETTNIAPAGAVAVAPPAVEVAEPLLPGDTFVPTTVVDPELLPATMPAAKPPIPDSVSNEQETLLATLASAIRPWLPVATATWLAGVLLLSLRPVWGWLHVRRLQRRGLSPLSVPVRRLCGDMMQRLGVRRAVRFAQSALVEVPTVVGYLRPLVLLPASAVSGLSPSQLEMILAHELAHIRRHDYLVNVLQTMVEALLFYHPGMWWVSAQIRKERENCCDDIAVATCGSRAKYVRALSQLEQQRAATPSAVLAATDGSLLQRVRRILGQPQGEFGYRNATAWLAGSMTIGLVAAACAMSGLPATADGKLTEREYEQLLGRNGSLSTLIQEWDQSRPRDAEAAKQYDVVFVVDTEELLVQVERGGIPLRDQVVQLPEGFTWQILRFSPERRTLETAEQLPARQRFAMRGHAMDGKVDCPELIDVIARSDRDSFSFSFGIGRGSRHPAGNSANYTFTFDQGRPQRESVVVSADEELQGTSFPQAVADRVAKVLQSHHMPFMTDERLKTIRADFAALVEAHQRDDLSDERKQAILTAIEKHGTAHLRLEHFRPNNHRSLNLAYLNLPDRLKTLQWKLWKAIARAPLSDEEQQRLDDQRRWMLDHVDGLPAYHTFNQADALADLNERLADPLCATLDRPMTDEQFADFQQRLGKYPRDKELGHVVSHIVQKSFYVRYNDFSDIELPFEDTVYGYGAGRVVHMNYESNRQHRGDTRSLRDIEQSHTVVDATTGYPMTAPKDKREPGRDFIRWLDEQGKGDFGYDDANGGGLFAVRGAKLMLLDATDWIEADALGNDALRDLIEKQGDRVIPLKSFYQVHRDQHATQPSVQYIPPYIGVLTKEGELSVVAIEDFSGIQSIDYRVRPRAEEDEMPKGLEFLNGIPEFSDLRLDMTEVQLKEIIARRKLDVRTDKSNQGQSTNYWLTTPEGKIVIVMFRDGECSGIQRMQDRGGLSSTTAKKLVGRWVGGGGIVPIHHTFSADGEYVQQVESPGEKPQQGTWRLDGKFLIREMRINSERTSISKNIIEWISPDAFRVIENNGNSWGYHRIDEQTGKVMLWGDPVDGLSVRLRSKQQTISNDKPAELLIDVHNQGPKTQRVLRARDGLWLEVDGKWYRNAIFNLGTVSSREFKPGDTVEEFLGFALQAGENSDWMGGHARTDGKVPSPITHETRKPDQPLVLATGKHRVRLALAPSDDITGQVAYAYSNSVEVEVVGDATPQPGQYLMGQIIGEDVDGGTIDVSMGSIINDDGSVVLTGLQHLHSEINVLNKTLDELVPELQQRYQQEYQLPQQPKVTLWLKSNDTDSWGEAVEGIQCRLKNVKQSWAAGETPRLLFGMKNGSTDLAVSLLPGNRPKQILFDGTLYEYIGPVTGDMPSCKPGESVETAEFPLANYFTSTERGPVEELKLIPGKHTVQAVVEALGVVEHTGTAIRVLSNPVEIDVSDSQEARNEAEEFIGITLVAKQDLTNIDRWRTLGMEGGFGQSQPVCDFIATKKYLTKHDNVNVIKKGDRFTFASAEVVDAPDKLGNTGTKLILKSAAPKEGLQWIGYAYDRRERAFWAVDLETFQASVSKYFAIESPSGKEIASDLLGKWQADRGEHQGEEMPVEAVKQIQIEFTKEILVIKKGAQATRCQWTFSDDEKSECIWMTALDGPPKYIGKPTQAFYKWQPDGGLQLCVPNRPERDDELAPVDFEEAKNLRRYIVLHLVKKSGQGRKNTFRIPGEYEESGTVRGKVTGVDSLGEPVLFEVMLDPGRERSGWPPFLLVPSGESFEFTNVPTRKYTLNVKPVVKVGTSRNRPITRGIGVAAQFAEVTVKNQETQIADFEFEPLKYPIAEKENIERDKFRAEYPEADNSGEKPDPIDFHGLKLNRSIRTSDSSKLPLLWEEVPPGSKSYEMRDDVEIVYQGLDGTVYYCPGEHIFYVQSDSVGSSQLTYYGPYERDPMKTLALPEEGVTSAGKKLATTNRYHYRRKLRESGAIRGKAPELPADLDATAVHYTIALYSEQWRNSHLASLSPRPGETFAFTNYPPGKYTVTMLVFGPPLENGDANPLKQHEQTVELLVEDGKDSNVVFIVDDENHADLGQNAPKQLEKAVASTKPANAISQSAQQAANRIVQELMQLRGQFAELDRFGEVEHQVQTTNGLMTLTVSYERNYAPGTKNEPAGPQTAGEPWCRVALNIWQTGGTPTQLELTALQPGQEIRWDGESNTRGYQITDTSWIVTATVQSDSKRFRRAVNGVIDNELNAMLQETQAVTALDSQSNEGWGEAVEGVSIRLESEQTDWPVGTPPRFRVAVRDQGGKGLLLSNGMLYGCRVEVDGQLYDYRGPEFVGQAYLPAKMWENEGRMSEWSLEVKAFQGVEDKQPLRLQSGKHTVRFAWAAYYPDYKTNPPEERPPVRVVSNPVEIEVVAASAGEELTVSQASQPLESTALESGGDVKPPNGLSEQEAMEQKVAENESYVLWETQLDEDSSRFRCDIINSDAQLPIAIAADVAVIAKKRGFRFFTLSESGATSAPDTLILSANFYQDRPQGSEKVFEAAPLAMLAASEEREVTEGSSAAIDKNAYFKAKVIDAETGEPIESFVALAGTDRMDDIGWQWQPHTIEQFSNGQMQWPAAGKRGYKEHALRIEAEGYQPYHSFLIKRLRENEAELPVGMYVETGSSSEVASASKPIIHAKPGQPYELTIRLRRNPGREGHAQLPDGSPAAGAQVALAMCRREIRIDDGKISTQPLGEDAALRDRWCRPYTTVADEQGRFTLPAEIAPAAIVIAHEDGIAALANREFPQDGKVQLEPWGSLQGRVVWGEQPGSKVALDIGARTRAKQFGLVVGNHQSIETDEDGYFTVEKLPPGLAQVSHVVKIPDSDSSSYRPVQFVEIQSGQPTDFVFGGLGQPIVGKLVGREDFENLKIRFAPNAPHPGLLVNENDLTWNAYGGFLRSEAGRHYSHGDIPVNANGTFRIEHVLPETYQLFVTEAGDNVGYAKFAIETLPGGTSDKPRNLGEIEVRSPPKSTNEARVSLTGQVLGLDGKPAVGYRVTALCKVHAGYTGWPPTEITDENGRFEFQELPDGPCDVAVTPNPKTNLPNLRVMGVELKEGRTARVALSLEQKHSLEGQFVDAQGTPLPDRNVFVIWNSRKDGSKISSSTKTDAEGHYRFTSPYVMAESVRINDGGRNINIHHNIQTGRDDVDFQIDGKDARTHTFRISGTYEQSGTIRGRVILDTDARGIPANYTILLEHERWRHNSGEIPYLDVSAGETFEFTNVPIGECTVRIVPKAGSQRPPVLGDISVMVRPRQTVELEFDQTGWRVATRPGDSDERATGELNDEQAELLEWIEQLNGLIRYEDGDIVQVVLTSREVDDASLERLKNLTNLQSLALKGSRISDAGLEHLKSLSKLSELDLYNTTISDAGLKHLSGLTELKFLVLKRANVTDAGVEQLRQALPNCMISHSPRTINATWGKELDGVEVRAHSPDVRWDRDHWVLFLKTDLRSEKPRLLPHYGAPIDEFFIEWDGVWYATKDRNANMAASVGLSKAKARSDLHTRIVARGWVEESTRQPMPKLAPGRHTLRIGFPLADEPDDSGQRPRAVSNLVDVEIVATNENADTDSSSDSPNTRIDGESTPEDQRRIAELIQTFPTLNAGVFEHMTTITFESDTTRELEQFGSAAVPQLVDALLEENKHIRRHAALVLGNIGDRQALQPLLECCRAEHRRNQTRDRWDNDVLEPATFAVVTLLHPEKATNDSWKFDRANLVRAATAGEYVPEWDRSADMETFWQEYHQDAPTIYTPLEILEEEYRALLIRKALAKLSSDRRAHVQQQIENEPQRAGYIRLEALASATRTNTMKLLGRDGKAPRLTWETIAPKLLDESTIRDFKRRRRHLVRVAAQQGEDIRDQLENCLQADESSWFRKECAEEILTAIRETEPSESEPDNDTDSISWGKIIDGVQIGLQPGELGLRPGNNPRVNRIGTRVDFTLWIRNTNDTPVRLRHFGPRGYAPTVTNEGRVAAVNVSPDASGPVQEKIVRLEPGARVSLGEVSLLLAPAPRVGRSSSHNSVRLEPGTYQVSQAFRFAEHIEPSNEDWSGKLQTGAVSLIVVPSEWGEPVEGVMMRITQDSFTIASGEKPDLLVDIFNGGNADRHIDLEHEAWELELDGEWLQVTGGVEDRRRRLPLAAGQTQSNVEVTPWLWENMTEAIENLSPGTHTLRVARLLNGQSRSAKDPPQIRVVSQPVEVEVVNATNAADFETLRCELQTTDTFNGSVIQIKPDGAYRYWLPAMSRGPDMTSLDDGYETDHKLSAGNKQLVFELLENTESMALPGAMDDLRIRDGSRLVITLSINGKEEQVALKGNQTVSAYGELVGVFSSMFRTEELRVNLLHSPAEHQRGRLGTLIQELREVNGGETRGHFSGATMHDYSRLLPALRELRDFRAGDFPQLQTEIDEAIGLIREINNKEKQAPGEKISTKVDLPNGVYRVRPEGSTDTGTEAQRSDAEGTVVLLGRLTEQFGTATMHSISNDNERFRLLLKGVGPLNEPYGPGHYALVVDGICVMVWGHHKPDDRGLMEMSADIAGRKAAETMAAGLKIEPRMRTHPGHQMQVSFTPVQERYLAGEPVLLRMTIKNIGDEPFSFYDGGRQRGARNNQFGFQAFRTAGKGDEVPDTGDPNHHGGMAALRTLAAGDSFHKEVDVAKWFDLSEPNSYLLKCSFDMELHAPNAANHFTLWDDVARGECVVVIDDE